MGRFLSRVQGCIPQRRRWRSASAVKQKVELEARTNRSLPHRARRLLLGERALWPRDPGVCRQEWQLDLVDHVLERHWMQDSQKELNLWEAESRGPARR